MKIPKFNSYEEAYNWIENQRFADMNQTDFNNISKLASKTPKSDFMKFVLENNDKIFYFRGRRLHYYEVFNGHDYDKVYNKYMETKEREKLELSIDDAWSIISEKHVKYTTIETNLIYRTPFGYKYETIFQRKSDYKIFKFEWREDGDKIGSFEDNNNIPFIAEEVFIKIIYE